MFTKSSLDYKVPQTWSRFLMILLVTSTAFIPLGLYQNQIANAQQQGFQNNQTSSYIAKQQPTGVYFDIDNMTFSHHTASVNGI